MNLWKHSQQGCENVSVCAWFYQSGNDKIIVWNSVCSTVILPHTSLKICNIIYIYIICQFDTRCVVCTLCSRTTPGKSCKWMSNYTLCGPCASLTTCPICKTLYKVDDLMIQCVECERCVKYVNIVYPPELCRYLFCQGSRSAKAFIAWVYMWNSQKCCDPCILY